MTRVGLASEVVVSVNNAVYGSRDRIWKYTSFYSSDSRSIFWWALGAWIVVITPNAVEMLDGHQTGICDS